MAKASTLATLAARRPNSIVYKLADAPRGYHRCSVDGCQYGARKSRAKCPVHSISRAELREIWTRSKVERVAREKERNLRAPNRAERVARQRGNAQVIVNAQTRDIRALTEMVSALAATVEKLAAR